MRARRRQTDTAIGAQWQAALTSMLSHRVIVLGDLNTCTSSCTLYTVAGNEAECVCAGLRIY